MASTSAIELAQGILEDCLQCGTWSSRALDALIERALDEEDEFLARSATRALFSVLIEPLADLFEPHLCEVYAKIFSHVISRALPEYDSADLLLRYGRVRQVRRFSGGEVNRVFVLSRVTLGADVAVTSVALAAAKHRFPDAEICFVGPSKNAELFAADPAITAVPLTYGRTSLLRDRLLAAVELHGTVNEIGAIVIDPDSRLTQLGLIPVCDDARYYFFESRAFGGAILSSLPQLTSEWLAEVFDIEHLQPYLAPQLPEKIADITVSWGVGDNPAKRLDDSFEYEILSTLLHRGRSVLLDRGAGGEEAERADSLVQRLGAPAQLQLHDGSYASFAGHIVQSELYVGYDSVGQHVAAAGKVPLVSVFSGYACERMLARWSPTGHSSRVVPIDETNRPSALYRTLEAIRDLTGAEAAAGRAASRD